MINVSLLRFFFLIPDLRAFQYIYIYIYIYDDTGLIQLFRGRWAQIFFPQPKTMILHWILIIYFFNAVRCTNNRFEWARLPDKAKQRISWLLCDPYDLAKFASTCRANQQLISTEHASHRTLPDELGLRYRPVFVSPKIIGMLNSGTTISLHIGDLQLLSSHSQYSFTVGAVEHLLNNLNDLPERRPSNLFLPVIGNNENRLMYIHQDIDHIYLIYASLRRHGNIHRSMNVYEHVRIGGQAYDGVVGLMMNRIFFIARLNRNPVLDIPSIVRIFRSTLRSTRDAERLVDLRYRTTKHCVDTVWFSCINDEDCHALFAPECVSAFDPSVQNRNAIFLTFSMLRKIDCRDMDCIVSNQDLPLATSFIHLLCAFLPPLDWVWRTEDPSKVISCLDEGVVRDEGVIYDQNLYSVSGLLDHTIFQF